MNEWVNELMIEGIKLMFSCIQNDANFCHFYFVTHLPVKLLSSGSSDYNLAGVILEKKKHAKWFPSYFLHIEIE